MKVFLIRHAEGENFETHWQSPSTPLSNRGAKQASAVSHINRFENIDKVYSSPFARARQTAQVITNKEIEIRNEISERAQSSNIYGQLRTNPVSVEYVKALAKNTDSWDYKWDEEEESKNEVLVRAISFKNFLINNCLKKNVLAVTHENFLRVFIAQCIVGEDSNDQGFRKLYKSLSIANTGISLLIYNEDKETWSIGYLNLFYSQEFDIED